VDAGYTDASLADTGAPARRTLEVKRSVPLAASADFAFPLCCPVEEYRWIPGWKCELVHCPNERVEQGTIFREMISGPILAGSPFGKTTWTAVLHEPARHRLHFRLQTEHSDSLYEIELEDRGAEASAMNLTFTYGALDERGERIIDSDGAARIGFMLDFISMMLAYYCEHQRCISPGAVARFTAQSDALGITDKIMFAITRLRQKHAKDEVREHYMRALTAGEG
jgi:hypothetical protein